MARAASIRLLLVLWPVAAIDVYTPGTVEALNGTDVRLKCTFRSHEPPGKRLAVTWTFRPLSGGPDQSVFYYHEEPYPMSTGRFSGRVTWDGNIQNSDASLMLWNVSPADNGTFQCHVKNPPNDVGGNIGEIQLAVVMKVTFSEIHILALTIGSACLLMIIIVVAVVVCRQQRRKRQEKDVEMVERERSEKEKLKKEGELEEEEKGLRGERA